MILEVVAVLVSLADAVAAHLRERRHLDGDVAGLVVVGARTVELLPVGSRSVDAKAARSPDERIGNGAAR